MSIVINGGWYAAYSNCRVTGVGSGVVRVWHRVVTAATVGRRETGFGTYRKGEKQS